MKLNVEEMLKMRVSLGRKRQKEKLPAKSQELGKPHKQRVSAYFSASATATATATVAPTMGLLPIPSARVKLCLIVFYCVILL